MIVFYFLYNKNTGVELIFLRCTKLLYSNLTQKHCSLHKQTQPSHSSEINRQNSIITVA